MSIRTRSSFFVLALVLAAPLALAQTEDDPALVAYRERFKAGLDRYKAGDVAQAIQYWEPLYRDLGPEKGYRVAYDLARAYESFGDATRAAERYEVFARECGARKDRGESLPDLVVTEASDATERLAALQRTRGRISIPATTPPASVAVDVTEPRLAGFVAYVAPGEHTIVFDPGANEAQTKKVTVGAGEIVTVSREAKQPLLSPVVPPPAPTTTMVVHPIDGAWVWVLGGATLISFALPILAYTNASKVYGDNSPATVQTQVDDYDSARTWAYASWAAPAVLGVATAALATWYFAGARTRVVGGATGKEASIVLSGEF